MAKFLLEDGTIKSYDQLVWEWKHGLLQPPIMNDESDNPNEPTDTNLLQKEADLP